MFETFIQGLNEPKLYQIYTEDVECLIEKKSIIHKKWMMCVELFK